MKAGAIHLLLAASLLAGCGEPASRARLADDPFAPVGSPEDAVAVDGMEVGHRLMASGEYELALKAYYRAAGDNGMTAEVLSALGSANLRLGRLGQAESLLRRAVAEDETNAPAWNNLGIVLMEQGEQAEASRVFRTAYALDNGDSTQIRENLRLALAKRDNPAYDEVNNSSFALVQQGVGDYRLLTQQ